MSTENEQPNAQGPSTGTDGQAQTQTPAPQTAGAEQFAGFQKRIDELTAKSYEAERRHQAEMQELRSLNTQLLSTFAAGQPQPQVQQPQVEIDPEIKKQMEAYTAPLLQQQQRQMSQVVLQMGQQALEAVVQGQDPRVAQRTRALYADAVAKGAHITHGFTPQQALTWARGELFDQLVADANKSKQVQQGQSFNAQPQGLPAQSAVAPSPGTKQAATAPDPEEDPEGASAFYAQQLAGKTF